MRWLALGVLMCCAWACSSTSAHICTEKISIDPQRREARTEEWMTLLLRGADHDCSGRKIEVPALPEKCSAFAEEGEALPLKTLGDDDVVVNRVDKARRLVWIITRRYANGEGSGPVALAEFTGEGVNVNALGTLRAMIAGAKLRLHPVGEGRKAGEVVTIEGGACEGADVTQCRRSLVLLARRSTALTNEHLENEKGKCIGPARIDLARKKVAAIENGWQREFELTGAVTYAADGVVVHEVVAVRDFDPKKRQSTLKEVRRAESDRAVRWVNGLLVVSEPPLWERMTE